jgi:choline dehydrogenase-like flavoprotein
MQTPKSPEVHDVVVIGTGASGGMAAWNLTRQGLRVLMLDAGSKFQRSQFWSHVKPWQVPRKIAEGQKPPQFLCRLEDRSLPYAPRPAV